MSSEKWEATPCDCGDPRCKSKVLWDRGLCMSLPMEADYAEARARELNAHAALVEALQALVNSERVTHSDRCQKSAVMGLLSNAAPLCTCRRDVLMQQARAALSLAQEKS